MHVTDVPMKPSANGLTIEVRARPGQPLGMPPARFLRDYWQQRPLLIRNAFADLAIPLTPEDLAGLACEELALSRLVTHEPASDRWALRSGPFTDADFAALPKTHWTLLVQDVDKWDVDVAALLSTFDFLPAWRVDDVMVSYAVDGGSVGAHVDQYDVFLLQGQGQRRWQISTDAAAPTAFRDDAELKLLRAFAADHEWLLEPGDMLYLPPGVPHHGVAIGSCLTFSIGMRAPAIGEMLADFAATVAERLPEELRYRDPGIEQARRVGEIDDGALEKIAHAMRDSLAVDATTLRGWFGSFITRYRAAHEAQPRPRPLGAVAFDKQIDAGVMLLPNPWSRFAWLAEGRNVRLFVAGEEHASSRAVAEQLCRREVFDAAELAKPGGPMRTLLRDLVNAGHLAIVRPRSTR